MGSIEDDLYALGMTIIALYHPNNPLIQLSKEAIMKARIEKGSYWSIAETLSFSARFSQLLNGLLADNPEQRWGIETLQSWLQGHKLNHVINTKKQENRSALEFNGHRFHNYRTLAHAMSQSPKIAATFIRSQKLQSQLNNIGDFELAKRISNISGQDSGNAASKDALLTTRATLLLDPNGPIRFFHYSFDFDQLGTLLQSQFENADIRKLVHDLFLSDIARFTIQAKAFGSNVKSNILDLVEQIEKLFNIQ